MVLNMAISSQSQWGNTCCNSVGAIMKYLFMKERFQLLKYKK